MSRAWAFFVVLSLAVAVASGLDCVVAAAQAPPGPPVEGAVAASPAPAAHAAHAAAAPTSWVRAADPPPARAATAAEPRGWTERFYSRRLADLLRALLHRLGPGSAPMAVMTVGLIALLAAFLTVVQIWQIPPPSTPLTGSDVGTAAVPAAAASGSPAAAKGAGTSGGQGGKADAALESFIASNFARTVFSGLGGMFLVTFLGAIWSQTVVDTKSLYLIFFVAFFLTLLFISALLRASGEALRSRLVMPYRAPIDQSRDWQPLDRGKHPAGWWRKWAWERSAYRWRCFWQWLLSWRKTGLVFWDTWFSVIQGKNQLLSAAVEQSVVELQTAMVRTATHVERQIHGAVVEALSKDKDGPRVEYSEIRVNISVLSDDQSSTFYVVWEPGSLPDIFRKRTLAWLCAYCGQALWWKDDRKSPEKEQIYAKDQPLLFGDCQVPGEGQEDVTMKSYYHKRDRPDYQAFVMLPIPWLRRAARGQYRMAALHISFRDSSHLDKLWSNLETKNDPPVPNYKNWNTMLNTKRDTGQADAVIITDPVLAAVLRQSLDVMAEVLRPFDQHIFEDYLLARLNP
jgi:hypothetical protein